MTNLSDQQIKFYNEKGYVAPIDVLSIQEANKIREEIFRPFSLSELLLCFLLLSSFFKDS